MYDSSLNNQYSYKKITVIGKTFFGNANGNVREIKSVFFEILLNKNVDVGRT